MSTESDEIKKTVILAVGIVGGILAALALAIIIIVSVICSKISSLKRQAELIHMSMSKTQITLDRFPKNIVQFPMTKSTTMDDDDRAGTEPASPIFFRKGYVTTPIATSLTSVTEIPNENQMIHHPLHRNNAMMPTPRVKQPGPPVPPKRAHSFNNHNFNY